MSNFNTTIFALFVLTVLFPKGAYMSETFYKEITLMDMVQMSRLVVVADYVGSTTETVPIPVKKTLPEKPLFTKTLHQFKIVEILKKTVPDTTPPLVSVAEANWASELSAQKQYLDEGIMESPIYPRYPSKADMKKRCIVFLMNEKGSDYSRYRFTVEGAVETPARKDAVLEVLKTKSNAPAIIELQE